MLSAVLYFLQWLLQTFAVAIHWVAESAFAPLVAAGFVLVTLFFVFLAERRVKRLLVDRFSVSPRVLAFTPLHARAAFVTLIVALVHGALHVLSRLLVPTGAAHFGPEGWVLGGLGLDVLVPLPYAAALPAAIGFYGYVYCVVLYGSALSIARVHHPAWAYLKGVFVVPFLPFSWLTWLLRPKEGKAKKERRDAEPAADAAGAKQVLAEGLGAEGEGKEEGNKEAKEEEKKEEEIDLAPVEFGKSPRWILFQGAHQRPTVSQPDLPNFRLFRRYHRVVRPLVGPLLLLTVVALAVPFLLETERAELKVPVGYAEYRAVQRAIGAREPPPGLLPEPFRDGMPEGYRELVAPLTVDAPESTAAEYRCTGETYDRLAQAAQAMGDPGQRARAVLNAALCRRAMSGISVSFSNLAFRVGGFDLLSLRTQDRELQRVRSAAGQLSGTPDGPRAWLVAGIVHAQPGHVRDAQRLFLEAVESAEAGDPHAFLSLVTHARLLVRLNRFDEVDDLFGEYAARTADAAEDGNARAKAFAALVRLNNAALLADTYLAEDAADELADLDRDLREDTRFDPLRARTRTLLDELGPDPANHRQRAIINLFGVLPASVLAALLLYLMALRRVLQTPLEEREGAPPAEREERAKEAGAPEEVPEEAILQALEESGFKAATPFPLNEGAARGGLDAQAQEILADAVRAVDAAEARRAPGPAAKVPPPAFPGQAEGPAEGGSARAAAAAKADRVTTAFLRELLRERGFYHGPEQGLYLHQRRALEMVAEARAKAEPTTVLLATPARSGRTTAALVAAMEALVDRGQSVIFVCADERHAREQAGFFQRVRAREVWSWNVCATAGAEGVERVLRDAAPLHLLFVDLATLHRCILPFERQVKLHGFYRSLGLLVVEDLDRFEPPALAHASFIFRRLAGVLAGLDQRPITLATALPVMAHEEEFVRHLFGALARHLNVVPADADDAEQAEQTAHVLRLRPEDERPYPDCSPEHTAAAVIQARGIAGATGETTWPAALVGYDRTTPEREDRALSIYAAFGATRMLDLAPSDKSRAVVFPLSAGTIGALDALTRHAGITARAAAPAEAADEPVAVAKGGEEAEKAKEEEPPAPPRHSVFLATGPEPIDRYLAWRLLEDRAGDAARPGTRQLLWSLRPEAVVPRRNRFVAEIHFERALAERATPGQTARFLEEVFDTDLLARVSGKALRAGRLDVTAVPILRPDDGRFAEEIRLCSPGFRDGPEEIRLDAYSPDAVTIVDRASGRRLCQVERCRAAATYYPGRVFVIEGMRHVVLSRRFQAAWERGELFAEPFVAAQRTSRIRRAALRPEGDEPDPGRDEPGARDQGCRVPAVTWSLGRGREFVFGCAGVRYREEVVGRRIFATGSSIVEAKERFAAEEAEFATEALVLGFEPGTLPLPDDAGRRRAVLHALVLLLRQALPLTLRARPDDVEIAFGAGDPPDAGGAAGRENDLEFRLQQHHEARALPWIAFVDRMDGALGYARFLHQRLLEGLMVPDLFRVALELARQANRAGDTALAIATSLNCEEEEFPAADVDGAAALLAALLGEELEKRGKAAPPAPAPAEEEGDEKADEERAPEGLAARRALLDPFGFGAVEQALADWALPEWPSETASPWAISFLCALRSLAPDDAKAARIERAVLALLALHRRRTGDDRVAPPAAAPRLAGYRPEDVPGPLDGVPVLAVSAPTAIEDSHGPLLRALGLVTGTRQLTERGCFLARALAGAPGFRQAFEALAGAVAAGRTWPAEAPMDRLVDGLHRADLPVACRRILADGLLQVPSVRLLGPAWFDTLDGRPQPDTVGAQLAQLAARAVELPARGAERVEALHAAHDLEARCRDLVSLLRAALSARPEAELREFTSGAAGEAALGIARGAQRFLETIEGRVTLPADARRFLSDLGAASEAGAVLRLLFLRMRAACGTNAPARLDFGRIRLSAGWQKKHPYSDSRGLRFRLHSLGQMIAETGWAPDTAPRLDGRTAVRCDATVPLPPEWGGPRAPTAAQPAAPAAAAPSTATPSGPAPALPAPPPPLDRGREDASRSRTR